MVKWIRKKPPKIKKRNSQKIMMDFKYFNDKHDELCLKHRNEFVAVKNQQVYSAKDPLKLLEILNENNVDPRYAVIEFIK